MIVIGVNGAESMGPKVARDGLHLPKTRLRPIEVGPPGSRAGRRSPTRIEPDLEPGDVVVFDSGTLHGVTEVEAGERVLLVSTPT